MAVVDVLDTSPRADAKHRTAAARDRDRARAGAREVPRSGDRHLVADHGQAEAPSGNYRESTASAMFAYFFAKAVRKGYLPDSPTRQTAHRKLTKVSIEEFVTVHADGKISMTNQCLVGGARLRPRRQLRLLHERAGLEERPEGQRAVHPRRRRAVSPARGLSGQAGALPGSAAHGSSPLT